VRRAVVALAVLLATLAAIVALGEALRPEVRDGPPASTAGVTDPRVAAECGAVEAREGEGREDIAVQPGATLALGSAEILNYPQAHDGRTVQLTGELVGGVLRRDGGAWVHLRDGDGPGLGVLLPSAAVQQVGAVGGPGVRGDVWQVTGTFHRVDRPTREVAVVRASSARRVEPGAALEPPPATDRRIVAAVLAPLALAGVVAARLVARRR
jgi:hypothetical protein